MGSAPEEVAGDLGEAGIGQDVEPVSPLAAEESHAAAEAGEGHEAVFETGAVADRVLDEVAVGRERQIGCVPAKGLERLQGEEGALLVAVAVFERVVLVEHAAGA